MAVSQKLINQIPGIINQMNDAKALRQIQLAAGRRLKTIFKRQLRRKVVEAQAMAKALNVDLAEIMKKEK